MRRTRGWFPCLPIPLLPWRGSPCWEGSEGLQSLGGSTAGEGQVLGRSGPLGLSQATLTLMIVEALLWGAWMRYGASTARRICVGAFTAKIYLGKALTSRWVHQA